MLCQQLNWLFKAFFSQKNLKKKIPIIQFPYMEIVWLAFFFSYHFFPFIYEETPISIPKQLEKYLSNSIKLILQKCMKFVWLAFFHRLSVWNCMISIFGLWRSTRVKTVYVYSELLPSNGNYFYYLVQMVHFLFSRSASEQQSIHVRGSFSGGVICVCVDGSVLLQHMEYSQKTGEQQMLMSLEINRPISSILRVDTSKSNNE